MSAARKREGRNVSVNEFPGKGTIINVDRKQATTPPPETCCDRDITEISAIDVTLSVEADFHGACGTGTRNETFTWNFVRIDNATAFTPGNFEFKLYFGSLVDGCCELFFQDIATALSSGVYLHDWGKADDICEDGQFRFPLFVETIDESCNTVTLDLTGANVIAGGEARYKSGGADCNDAPCTYTTVDTGFADLATGIELTTCDFSNLLGTYTLSHTHSDTDVDLTVGIQFVIS